MNIYPIQNSSRLKSIATNLDAANLNIFKQLKKNYGIKWSEVKEFSQSHVVSKNKLVLIFSKSITGSTTLWKINKPQFNIKIKFNGTKTKEADSIDTSEVLVELWAFANNTKLAMWILKRSDYSTEEMFESILDDLLRDELGLTGRNLETARRYTERKSKESVELSPVNIHGQEGYYYHRLTRIQSNAYPASAMELFIIKAKLGGYQPLFNVFYFETDSSSGVKDCGPTKTLGDAVDAIDVHVKICKEQKGYVDKESVLYIPEGATKDNWNFTLHKWKKVEVSPLEQQQQEEEIMEHLTRPDQPDQPDQPQTETSQEYNPPIQPRKKRNFKTLFGQNQDFGGYFQGEIPDYAGSLVGTPSVDASQIAGMFSGTSQAISLVNSYTSDALKNVAYIFNFSKGGAYGVYIPALDKAIKTKALTVQLEQKGYQIKEENGLLKAHPIKGEKSPEEIDRDIDILWNELNSGGGSALGINMSDVLNATQQNASTIMRNISQGSPEVPQQIQNILNEILGIYHLAAIILHEASHAKGGDEGKAQSDEAGFRNWAQGFLNKEYQSKLSGAGLDEYYTPLELGQEIIHASIGGWYRDAKINKTAQSMMGRLNYSPSKGSPGGSDLAGRHKGQSQGEGFAEWAMLVQQDQSIPIEKRLTREKMSKLERGVDQANDSIEEQLRKQFVNDFKPNVQLITEELLSPSRDESQGYKSLESMLEEMRPQPLMTPLKKVASIFKEARQNSLFGWYNNLEISDGSTIPGLGDRVMAWDDRDESFSGEEDTIRSQSRYNPTYDLKGFYYRWIEPRFKPELFDDMTRDYSNTHPAKRFAGVLDVSITKMLGVLKAIENEIINENIKATRIVTTTDLLDTIKKLLDKEGLSIKAYKIEGEQDLFAVWAHNGSIHNSHLDQAEQYFQNVDGASKYRNIAEGILQDKEINSTAVERIIDISKELCKQYDIDDLYVVGEYARKIFDGEASPCVNELHFICETIDPGLKLGGLLSNQLNVPNEYVIINNLGITFPYKGIKVFFSRGSFFPEIGAKMQERNYDIESPLMREVCNKDFTINTMIYDVRGMRVIDPVGAKVDIKNKIIKTLFDPEFIFSMNPMMMLRAVYYKLQGYTLDEDIERAIIKNSVNLSNVSPERLKFCREYLKSVGSDDIDKTFIEYGLTFGETQPNQEVI